MALLKIRSKWIYYAANQVAPLAANLVAPLSANGLAPYWCQLTIREYAGISVHSSTLRWLPELGIVWQRAAPTSLIRDPHRDEKLSAIKEALDNCNAEHPVFYEDEVDIHLNPKIGADWGAPW